MDRCRESRRSSCTSSFRRKHPSSAVDKDHEEARNSRLRDRAKKESSSSAPALLGSSRNKRKRKQPYSQETEVGASEEEEDTIARTPSELRLHGKILHKISNAVDIAAVPRKARSAVAKRLQESTYAQECARQKSLQAAASSSSPTASTSSAAASSISMKRTKPNANKLQSSKLCKFSTACTISEQEVEVAEALFDLARTVPKQLSPVLLSECKLHVKPGEIPVPAHASPWSPPALVSSPAFTSIPPQDCTPSSSISTPPSSSPARAPAATASVTPLNLWAAASAEAPKRKRPCVRAKIDDGTCTRGETRNVSANTVEGSPLGLEVDVFHPNRDPGSTGLNGSISLGNGSVQGLTGMAVLPLPVPVESTPVAESNSMALGNHMNSLDNAATGTSSSASKPTQQASADECRMPDANYPLAKLEGGKSRASDDAESKYEIDLMATPQASASGTSETLGSSLVSAPSKLTATLQKNPPGASIDDCMLNEEMVKDRDDVEINMHIYMKEGESLESVVEGTDNTRNQEKDGQQENLEEKEREEDNINDFKQDPLQIGKKMKSDLRLDGSVPFFPMASPPVSSGAIGSSTSASLPISMGMACWPGGLPHMRYYSAAAAAVVAWPAPPSIIEAASVDVAVQVPPFAFPGAQQPCKRCAIHVYIAHFIDAEQQMRRHPLWTAAYWNTATNFSPSKSYNLNVPLSPKVLFGSGASGTTALSGNNSTVPGNRDPDLMSGSHNDRGRSTAVLQSSKSKGLSSYMDVNGRKDPMQQPAQAETGPVFGYPVTQAGSSSMCSNLSIIASSGAGGTPNLTSCSPDTGTAAPVASCLSVVGPAINTSNCNVASATASQIKYLQATIQQSGFPFSYPSGQFGGPFHAPQGYPVKEQAKQFSSNPLYITHTVHPSPQAQQGPSDAGSTVSVTSSFENHHPNLQQGARITHSKSQQQQQQQQQALSASATQSQQMQSSGDKELVVGIEAGCSANSKFSIQRNMYSQALSSIQVPTVTSSLSAVAATMQAASSPQNFPVRGALGGKNVGKLPNDQQEFSNQLQAHQQVTVSTQFQPHLITQHHTAKSALHLSLRGMGQQAFQASVPMSVGLVSRTSVGPGLAPVASVMAPQDDAVFSTVAVNLRDYGQAHHEQPCQQHRNACSVEESVSSIGESTYSSSSKVSDNVYYNRMAVKRALTSLAPSKMVVEVSPNAQGCPMDSSGGTHTLACTPGVFGASFNLMASPLGELTSQQVGNVPIGRAPAPTPPSSQSLKPTMGNIKAVSDMTGAGSDSTSYSFSHGSFAASLNKISVTGMPFHKQSRNNGSPTVRQGQTKGQLPCQAKPATRVQTAGVSTTANALAPGKFVGTTVINFQGQPAKGEQPFLNAMSGSRLSPTVTGSSTVSSLPLPTLFPVSTKSSNVTVAKSIPLAKSPSNTTHKQNGGNLPKQSGPVLTQTSASILSASPMHAKVGPSLSQSQQHHGQHNQHNFQQQQQFPQSLLQHVHLSGQQTMTLQYWPQPVSKQASPQESQKQSVQPQLQLRHQLFLQQQQQSLQQAQSHSLSVLNPMPYSTDQQSRQPMVQQSRSIVTQSTWQHFNPQQQQSGIHQSMQPVFSSQQPSHLPSFGIVSSVTFAQSSPTSNLETSSTGRVVSSDRVLNEVTGSRSATTVKSSGSSAGPPFGSNLQRSTNSSPHFFHVQKVASITANSPPQPSHIIGMNASSLSYTHSVSLSSSVGASGKLVDVKGLTDDTFCFM